MNLIQTEKREAANDGKLSSTLKGYSLNPLEKIEVEPFRRSEGAQSIDGETDDADADGWEQM